MLIIFLKKFLNEGGIVMPKVCIILGSNSDKSIVMESGMLNVFNEIKVSWELSVISAHRNHHELQKYCREKVDEIDCFIGVAGMAAALPGAIVSIIGDEKVVIGVPLKSDILDGLDALYSMVRMPSGRPVAVCGIGKSGLYNAAILACQIIALSDPVVRGAFQKFCAAYKKPVEINILSSKYVQEE